MLSGVIASLGAFASLITGVTASTNMGSGISTQLINTVKGVGLQQGTNTPPQRPMK